MTIKQIKGDLLEHFEFGKVDAMLHVANCRGVMGSGIAFKIRDRFQVAYDSYKAFQNEFGLSLGSVSSADVGGKTIFNLHAQEDFGKDGKVYLSYDALRECLQYVKDNLPKDKVIGIPRKMGSDLAGGDWEKVLGIVCEMFRDRDVVVVSLE